MSTAIAGADISLASDSSTRRTGLSNGRHISTSFRQNGHHVLPGQVDPLIESLDEEEEIEVWLNKIVASQRSSRDACRSALQLRGIDDNIGKSSSQSSWTASAGLESHLSSLSSTLSFARQDTMTMIDNTIADVSTSIPRLGLELRLMKDAALTLKGNVDRLRMLSKGQLSETTPNDQTASAALERLSALSTLHSRMSSARDVLSLAESWSTLAADVTSYLNEAKLSRASSRLAEAKKTLTVFERTPEYESRKALLEGLCESLVNGVRPSLENAVKEKDLQRSQELAHILASIGKEDQFTKVWHKTRTAHWLAQWKSIRKEGGFVEALPRLIASFLDLLNEEKLFVPTLYPANPRQSMEGFISSTFSELDPSLTSRLQDTLESSNGRSIINLVEVYTLLRDAVSSIAVILHSVESTVKSKEVMKSPMISSSGHVYQHSPTAISPSKEINKQLGHPSLSPQSPSHTRPRQGSHNHRNSRRLSVPSAVSGGSVHDVFDDPSPQGSIQVKLTPVDLLLSQFLEIQEWERSILQPMLDWQANSVQMEREYIAAARRDGSQLSAANRQQNSKLSFLGAELGTMLVADASKAKELSQDACMRSIQLTFGFAGGEIVSCCEEIFCDLLSNFKQALGTRSSEVIEYARRQAGYRRDGEREGVAASSVEEYQWKSFEDGVSLLSSLYKVEMTMTETEKMISMQLKDTAELLLAAGSPAANEAILRLIGNQHPSSKAPMALLARHLQDRLQSGDLLSLMSKIRIMAKETRTALARDESSALFIQAQSTLLKQVKGVQQHLVDVTLAPLLAHMEVYTQLPIWQANRLPGSVNEYELAMPTFSLSPTEEMSKIGEGLLNLPRLLEVWNDNQSLRWAMQGLPFIATEEEKQADISVTVDRNDINTSPSINRRSSFQAAATGSSVANPLTSPSSERRQTLHRHTSSLAAIATQTGTNSISTAPLDNTTTSSTTMLQTYLSSIALSLVSHIVSLVLPSIVKLTTAGSLQLVADLEYLLNILSALNVNSAAFSTITSVDSNNTQAVLLVRTLEAWKDSCKIKEADGQRIMTHIRNGQMAKGVELVGIEGFEEDGDRLSSLAGTQVFEMVARMRNW